MVSNVDGQSAPAEELGPTDSHSLSRRSADQEENESSVNADDAKEGWRARSPQDLNQRIIPHIPNEDLWMLIRRFNKVVSCLVSTYPAGRLTSRVLANV